MKKKFFPARTSSNPKIYAYSDSHPDYAGLLKIGYTTLEVKKRVAQQYPTVRPGRVPYTIVYEESAMRSDGTAFTDHDVHRYLRKRGFLNPNGEWFKCRVEDIQAACYSLISGEENVEHRSLTFGLRPEQRQAVEITAAYYKSSIKQDPNKTPHFLWNAKMRFGKTFASYHLAKIMNWKKVLVLTFKPAVQGAWEEDLKYHVDFKGWQFISPGGLSYDDADHLKPYVCFGSFQDYLGRNKAGGIKAKNEWVHDTKWDLVILDEYHYGAWRENAKDLFNAEDKKEVSFGEGQDIENYNESDMPITTKAYLYLSGTPFRAIASGEFIEDQIYNWTYSDEQKAKANWEGHDNPYQSLPRIVLMTYQMPDSIKQIAMQGEFNEFDLNVFFSAEGNGTHAKFKYENEVQKWLGLIRGDFLETAIDDLKQGAKKPPMPFSHAPLLKLLTHTFWFLPSVSSCHAMKNLLKQRQNRFYSDYRVIVAAGPEAGIGVDALEPVRDAMDNPLETKTITLSCGKLTTGVTVKPWCGIFMLRNSSSPETYFQAAFRVQSPWTVSNPDTSSPNKELIIKEECYVFDFAPDRALKQIADYSCRLNVGESNPEKKVKEFISFLPVLAYDGSSMKQIDAAGILDMAMSGTTATLLARRWESAMLVNVDDITLKRLMENQEAMDALMRIEGFRGLNADIQTIINKSESIKKAKQEANEKDLSVKQKKQLTEDEKERKSLRKQVQEKLIKFATRIPIFMYLTDDREHCLKDVIAQTEPGLFQRSSGLSIQDFELLVSIGVFNSALMNDAVYKFKRYEDSSLIYTGIDNHVSNSVGLWDTTISYDEYVNSVE
jgi:hypothetical protein